MRSASKLLRSRKGASLRLGLGEIKEGEVAGRHNQRST